jgi:hypothetical protein
MTGSGYICLLKREILKMLFYNLNHFFRENGFQLSDTIVHMVFFTGMKCSRTEQKINKLLNLKTLILP